MPFDEYVSIVTVEAVNHHAACQRRARWTHAPSIEQHPRAVTAAEHPRRMIANDPRRVGGMPARCCANQIQQTAPRLLNDHFWQIGKTQMMDEIDDVLITVCRGAFHETPLQITSLTYIAFV
jgi:hypothetical protein